MLIDGILRCDYEQQIHFYSSYLNHSDSCWQVWDDWDDWDD